MESQMLRRPEWFRVTRCQVRTCRVDRRRDYQPVTLFFGSPILSFLLMACSVGHKSRIMFGRESGLRKSP